MRSRRNARGGRLSRSAEFERVYRQGRSTANRHLVLYAFPNAAVERPRIGLSVSRKVGGAVQRNKVKRLLREAFSSVRARSRTGSRSRGRGAPGCLGSGGAGWAGGHSRRPRRSRVPRRFELNGCRRDQVLSADASTGRLRVFARVLVSAPISAYSRFISPAIPQRCRYEPTCSRYAVERDPRVRHT